MGPGGQAQAANQEADDEAEKGVDLGGLERGRGRQGVRGTCGGRGGRRGRGRGWVKRGEERICFCRKDIFMKYNYNLYLYLMFIWSYSIWSYSSTSALDNDIIMK